MKILIDTSILVRVTHTTSENHQRAVDAMVEFRRRGMNPCVVPQVFYEFWVVVTRPTENNGLGYSADQATLGISQLASFLQVIQGEDGIFSERQRLVTQYKVIGKNAHDTQSQRLQSLHQNHGSDANGLRYKQLATAAAEMLGANKNYSSFVRRYERGSPHEPHSFNANRQFHSGQLQGCSQTAERGH